MPSVANMMLIYLWKHKSSEFPLLFERMLNANIQIDDFLFIQNMLETYIKHNQSDQAIDLFEKIKYPLAPYKAQAYRMMINLYNNLQSYDRAATLRLELKKIAPDYGMVKEWAKNNVAQSEDHK